MNYKKQVGTHHYDFESYVNESRWSSYYHQLRLVSQISKILNKKRLDVLEIGVGNRLVSNILQHFGHKLVTMDVDKVLKPDIVKALPKVPVDRLYDCVVCCQVIEHISYADAQLSIRHLCEISKYLILSVPHKGLFASFVLHFSLFWTIRATVDVPFYHFPHSFSEHYWEIGSFGISKKKFRNDIENSGWNVLSDNRLATNPYHRFYLLQSKKL